MPSSENRPSLAKLSPPRLPKVVERQRIFKELDKAKDYPITWITAPPGMGKTTLAASYIKARKLRCLWYQVDEGDADPATLFHYLGLASKKAAPRYKQPLPHLTPEYLPGLQIFTRRFFEKLFARIKPPGILVLDNFQELPSNAHSQEILAMGFQEIPNSVRVVVLSRTDPPPTFVRLQAEQKMYCLKEAALNLTEQETGSIVKLKVRTKQKNPEKQVVRQLHQMTGGWVAGVVLSLEHGERDVVQTKAEQLQTPEFIFEYLAREVMKNLSEEVQEVLLRTAFASSVTESMAHALTGNEKVGKILNDLHRRRYFTERRLEAEPMYQYHPLFRSFLQRKNKERLSKLQLTQLLTETAQTLVAHDRGEDAIVLFQEVQAIDQIKTIILSHAQYLITQGRHITLENWIRQLPEAWVNEDPWLLYWLGSCHRLVNLSEAEVLLIRSFTLFKEQHDQTGLLMAWAGVVDILFMSWSEWKRVDPWLDAVPGLVTNKPNFPESEVENNVFLALFCGWCWIRPDHPNMSIWLDQGKALLQAKPDFFQQSPLCHVYMSTFIALGDTNSASMICDRIKSYSTRANLYPLARLSSFYSEAHYAWFVGDRTWCDRAVAEAVAFEDQTGCLVMHVHLRNQQVYAAFIDYDVIVAEKILTELAPDLGHMSGLMGAHFHLQRGWVALLGGESGRALPLLRQAFEYVTDCGAPFPTAHVRLLLAQACYSNGHCTEAQEHITQAETTGQGMKSALLEFLVNLTRAWIALDESNLDKAHKALQHGMRVARIKGFQYFPWWPKLVLAQLCTKAIEWDVEVEYVQLIIRKYRLAPEGSVKTLSSWPWAVNVQTLGNFAIDVDGDVLEFPRKSQRRPLMLLKALIAFGSQEVSETQLSDALWPDADGDLAHQSFATTLHRLRKLLNHEQAILLKDGKVSLNPECCWSDVWAFEQGLDIAQERITKSNKKEALDAYQQALSLYKGSFLPDDLDEPWTYHMRERLRGRFIRDLVRCSEQLSQSREPKQAVSLLTQAIEREPLAEPLYRALASTLRTLKRNSEAQSVEDQFQQLARHSLGVEVTKPTLRLVSNTSKLS